MGVTLPSDKKFAIHFYFVSLRVPGVYSVT